MGVITKIKAREIIEDFAEEVKQRKTKGPKPAKCVIDFRNERKDGIERYIYYIPTELLRYRKDNGRISSDVLHYEKSQGLLNERSEEAQKVIEDFLRKKDKEKTEELYRTMAHDGQREPAIITCDGFLINGNRRKMVLEELRKKYPGNPKYELMKVVILPGKDEEGGPPTLLEIEQIENRYQLQSEAKAEYYAFDRALSIRRKIIFGMTLEEQLRDDPIYAGLDDKKFKEEAKKYEKEYLKPLSCIDRYLEYLGRPGLYSTVSTRLGDPEGRWQAFHDYYIFVYQKLKDDKKRIQLGISEDEIGKIEDAAFKIIRKRDIKDMPKAHMMMRNIPKWLQSKESKKEFLKLVEVENDLSKAEKYDKDGNEYNERDIDKIWSAKHETIITKFVKNSKNLYDQKKEQETPVDLLNVALNKLNHENMDPESIRYSDYMEAMRIARKIKERANELESQIYNRYKQLKSLMSKHSK